MRWHMPTVVPIEDLRKSETAALFQGGDEIPVSIFVTEHPRGKGAALHFHPYPEAFVVQSGTAVFTVGDEQGHGRGRPLRRRARRDAARLRGRERRAAADRERPPQPDGQQTWL